VNYEFLGGNLALDSPTLCTARAWSIPATIWRPRR